MAIPRVLMRSLSRRFSWRSISVSLRGGEEGASLRPYSQSMVTPKALARRMSASADGMVFPFLYSEMDV